MENYETFFEYVWDTVSEAAVPDDLWYSNEDKFQELTFQLFNIYSGSYMQTPGTGNQKVAILTPSVFAKIIEIMFTTFKDRIKAEDQNGEEGV